MRRAILSEQAGKILMSRSARRSGIPVPDSPLPAHFTPEAVERVLKIVAYMEGGPDPDSAEAVAVELNEEFEDKP